MRLSVLAFTAFLLISSIVIAQHTGGAPSTPPPSPTPSAAPSPPPPPPPPAPPPPPPPAPSPSFTHTAPSAPPPVSVPETHVAPSPTVSPEKIPDSNWNQVNSGRDASDSHAPQPDVRGITPEQKISGESRIVGAPKIGEKPPEKEPDLKKEDPELRRPICEKGDCKEPPKPQPPESELRRPICFKGVCPCPPGQTAGKGGCVTTSPPPCKPGSNEAGCAGTVSSSCPAGQVWNGATCVPNAARCPAGQVWNGAVCQADCSIANAGSAIAILKVSNARRERDEECTQNPSGMLCQQLDGNYQTALAEYRLLLAGVPLECRSTLPAPESL